MPVFVRQKGVTNLKNSLNHHMYVVVYLLHVLPVFVYFKSIVDCLVTSTPASRKPLKCYLNNDQTDVLLDLSKLHGLKFTDFWYETSTFI